MLEEAERQALTSIVLKAVLCSRFDRKEGGVAIYVGA